tara:strand:+ start:921 stop:1955 length:1035 start_codon:yes stop_codon:yes gene_type:complete
MSDLKTIFVTSAVRSGAALFINMLNVNDDIKVSSGLINFFRFYFKKYDPVNKYNNYEKLFNQFNFRLKNRFGINLDTNNFHNKLKKNINYSNIYKLICSEIFKDKKFKIIGEHAGNEWRNISNYLQMFPKGKVIIILRDPRDIICSFKKNTIAKKNDYLISLFNFVDLINYSFLLKKDYPKNIQIIKFNELKKDSIFIMKKVCKFLGIKFNKKMINEKYFKDINGKKWDQTKAFSFTGKLKKNNIDRWKSIMKIEDLFLCEFIAKKQMKMMGLKKSNIIFNKKIIDKGLKKITSSTLLTDSFLNWINTQEGNDKYPLDPTKPKNWDMSQFKDPKKFKILKKNKD